MTLMTGARQTMRGNAMPRLVQTTAMIGLASMLIGVTNAQQYEGTPPTVEAMNTMECVTYYTAFAEVMTGHEYKNKQELLGRAAEIIKSNTPEDDRAAHLAKAEKARADAVFVSQRYRKGVISREDLAGLVAKCDASFGFDALADMHDQTPEDDAAPEAAIVGNN